MWLVLAQAKMLGMAVVVVVVAAVAAVVVVVVRSRHNNHKMYHELARSFHTENR